MTPELAAMLIASTTDAIIRVSAKHEGMTYKEMKAKIETLQPKADELENWLREGDK